MIIIRSFLITLFILFQFSFYPAYAEKYPLRKEYPNLKFIEKEELFKKLNNVLIVDTRSNFEYNTIHIKNSINIDYSNRGFQFWISEYKEKNTNKDIIFYCNGILCKKSYEAAKYATNIGYKKVWIFDEGILAWVKTYPENTVLIGQTPANLNYLPNEKTIALHTLNFTEFKNKLDTKKNSIAIDLREPLFRKKMPKLPNIHSIKINNFIESLKANYFKSNELFIFDSVGRQTEWVIIYLIKYKNYKEFWLLNGGVDSLKDENILK